MRNTQPQVDERDERTCRRDAEALVRAVPHDELPDATDREALVEAVLRGLIEHIYQPLGASYTNVCVSGLPPYVDQRLRVTIWAQWRREGKDIRATMLARAR